MYVFAQGGSFLLCKAGLTLCDFFKSPLGLYLSDCTNIMIISHCGISVVINVRLYDSQDALKTGARKKTYPEFYIINPYTFSDWELLCTRERNVGCHENYMNGGNTGVFKKNSSMQLAPAFMADNNYNDNC